MNEELEDPVPPAVVTEILPLATPLGIWNVSFPAASTEKLTLTPPIFTEVAPPRLVPVTVTSVPAGPLVGEKLLMTGATDFVPTVKLDELAEVPEEVVTEILPLAAPAGTPVTTEAFEITVNGALTPLKATRVIPVKLVPEIVTAVPTPPEVGVKPEIKGRTLKELGEVAVPPAVVSVIGPEVAPAGTVAVTWVEETNETLVDATPLN